MVSHSISLSGTRNSGPDASELNWPSANQTRPPVRNHQSQTTWMQIPTHFMNGIARHPAETGCCHEGFDGFVTSTTAPLATGWSDPVGRAGITPAKNQ